MLEWVKIMASKKLQLKDDNMQIFINFHRTDWIILSEGEIQVKEEWMHSSNMTILK